MSLALQVKKFINSEHTGSYADIQLPGFPIEKDGDPVPEDVRIHYFEAGVGEPLLLVHAPGQSAYTWRNVFDRLSQQYRVIAIDLLGHGYSSRPQMFDYTIPEHSMVLELFMDAIGIQSAHMVGFSMGALYVLDFALQHPERTGRLVLMSPGGVTPEMPSAIRMIDSTIWGGIACQLYNIKTVRTLLRDCLFDLTTLTDETVREYYHTVADSQSRKAIRLCLHNFDEEDVSKELRNINNDILILWGAEDKWHLPVSAELYHSALANAQFCVLRNAGHLMHEEKPDKFIQTILEYIPAPID